MRTIENIAAAVLCLLSAAACSDWTRPESMELDIPTLEERSPELWKQYLASLRKYKESDHRMTLVKFDNPTGVPGGQHQHISALPDSVDYIILTNPRNITGFTAGEMKKAGEKGTKFLFTADFVQIEKDYGKYLEELAESEEPVTFASFLRSETESLLNSIDNCLFDGCVVAYKGISPLSIGDVEELEEMKNNQEIFFSIINEYVSLFPEKHLLFEGVPANIICGEEFVPEFKWYIIDVTEAKNRDQYDVDVITAFGDRKAVRTILKVAAFSERTGKRGLLETKDSNGEPVRSITGAAAWTVQYDREIDKAGICINNVQDDYLTERSYKYSSKAISIMNPSPLD